MSGVETLRDSRVRARKEYRCGMCNVVIRPGDLHRASVNKHDGDLYTWRECLACERDQVCLLVHDWTGGYYDEGVGWEEAYEWAEETAVGWPTYYRLHPLPSKPISATERAAARAWLARAAGGEGE